MSRVSTLRVVPVLSYQGSAKHFQSALRQLRPRMKGAGTVLGDDVNRKRFQRLLRNAQMASIRAEILRGGGDVA